MHCCRGAAFKVEGRHHTRSELYCVSIDSKILALIIIFTEELLLKWREARHRTRGELLCVSTL